MFRRIDAEHADLVFPLVGIQNIQRIAICDAGDRAMQYFCMRRNKGDEKQDRIKKAHGPEV